MSVLKSGDRDGSGMLSRGLLDRLPGRWHPESKFAPRLAGGQLGQFIRSGNTTRVDLADAQTLARGLRMDCGGAVAERHIDRPRGGLTRIVAPKEGRGGDLGRKDRSFCWVVDRNRGERLTARCG